MEGADPGGKGTGAIMGECLCTLHLPSVTSLALTPRGTQAGRRLAGQCLATSWVAG